jgi:hypothetical protein
MFVIMNEKWWTGGLLLAVFLIFIYGLVELFLLDYAAEKRSLNDKRLTIEIFVEQEEVFNEKKNLNAHLILI